MQQIFRCNNCGSQYNLGQQFCTVCGHNILYQCPQCQNEISAGIRFCTRCAAELNWGPQQNTAPATIPVISYPQELPSETIESVSIDKKERNKKSRSVRPWFISLIIIIIAITVLFIIDTFYK
jgi:hypothetical protein